MQLVERAASMVPLAVTPALGAGICSGAFPSVLDGGPGQRHQRLRRSPVDRWRGSAGRVFGPLTPPTSCPIPSDLSNLEFPVGYTVGGEWTVHDAPALPTSKDQCKNGGWRNFGSLFRNQGDCVSFVATGGKNPPALGNP
jgi:hypothetical protein